jgi:hypothetical protein
LHEAIPELAEVRPKTSRVPTQAPPEATPVPSPPLFALPPNIYEENMNPKMMASHSVRYTNQILCSAEEIQLVLRLIPQVSPGFG